MMRPKTRKVSSIRFLARRAARKVRKILFVSLPHTPPLVTYINPVIPSWNFLKRSCALAIAFMYFWTQIVFAQSVVMAMPKGCVPAFFGRVEGGLTKLWGGSKVVFGALPFGFDKLREDRERSGYLTTDQVLQK